MRASPDRRPWSSREDELIRDLYVRRVHGRSNILAQQLGRNRIAIWKRADVLGVAERRATKAWRPEEEATLHELAGEVAVDRIASRLHRSVGSTKAAMRRLGLSWRVSDGYTLKEIAECFGVSRERALSWILSGKLRGTRRYEHDGHAYQISEAEVRHFIRRHRDAYDLRRVEPTWFLDLVFGERVA